MNLLHTRWIFASAFLAVGCEAERLNSTSPVEVGRSGALVYSEKTGLAYFADTDRGSIGIFDVSAGTTRHFEVGGEPHKLALTDERLLVTQRTARSLLSLHIEGRGLRVENVITVGAEPGSVVTDSSGTTAYVAVSMEDVVAVVDLVRGEVKDRLQVSGQPEWLTFHRKRVWVGTRRTTGAQALVMVDPERGTSTPIPLPVIPAIAQGDRATRILGDPVVSPDGHEVLVPVSYPEPPTWGLGNNLAYYKDPAMLSPAIVRIPVDDAEPAVSGARVILTPAPGTGVVAISPGGHKFAFSDPTARSTGLLPTDLPPGPHAAPFVSFRDFRAIELEYAVHAAPAAAPSGLGTRGLVFSEPDVLLAYSAFEHTITVIDTRHSDDRLGVHPWLGGRAHPTSRPDGEPVGELHATRIEVSAPSLPEEVALGRDLFHDAQTSRLAGPLASVACASCHPDGRSDGLTWQFPGGFFQTPVAAGAGLTLPLRWVGDRATIEEDVLGTAVDLLGAIDPTHEDARLVARYIESLRDLDVPDLEPESTRRGQLLFESTETGCASCHSGARYTDGKLHPSQRKGMPIDTPSLIGVTASAPYLCDGRAATLEEAVIEHERDGLGRVSHLSRSELDDLVQYLRTR